MINQVMNSHEDDCCLLDCATRTEEMTSGSFADDVALGREATHGRAEMVAQLGADGVKRQ